MQPPREFLVFGLWGPMASWGEVAVGERRGSWARPSRSAVLGLVAAALGIDRKDAAAHDRFERDLGFAVRVHHPGKPLRDYHTAQSPSQKRGVRWATRREELNPANNINTILSERGYYQEADAVVALWLHTRSVGYSLAEIAAHLAEPVFTLYLGRKSCPLGLPLPASGEDMIFQAESLQAALDAYDKAAEVRTAKLGRFAPQQSRSRRQSVNSELWLGEDDAHVLGLPVQQRTQRRDGIRDRARWLFNDRAEVLVREAAP